MNLKKWSRVPAQTLLNWDNNWKLILHYTYNNGYRYYYFYINNSVQL